MSKQVLVVDDDDDFRALVAETLERAGYEVVVVGSGADALAFLARTDEPWQVVLDLEMHDMDGYEVLGALRSARRDRTIDVLVVSGADPAAMPHGTRWLRKPVRADALLDALAGYGR